MVLERERQRLFPARVEHDVADMALGRLRACLPAGLRGDEIDMPGEGRIRGRVNGIIIGDSGTGKSWMTETAYKHANVGFRISGMTATRTGITYSCHQDARGWRIKAGAIPKMTGQALILDEAQDIPMNELKTAAEALDHGYINIQRVENTFRSCFNDFTYNTFFLKPEKREKV